MGTAFQTSGNQFSVNIIMVCRGQVTDQKGDSNPGKCESRGEERKRHSSNEEMNDQEAAR